MCCVLFSRVICHVWRRGIQQKSRSFITYDQGKEIIIRSIHEMEKQKGKLDSLYFSFPGKFQFPSRKWDYTYTTPTFNIMICSNSRRPESVKKIQF